MNNIKVYPVVVTHNNGEVQIKYYDVNVVGHSQLYDMYAEMFGILSFEIGEIVYI